MKAISTTEFREHQKKYLDLVDANEKVIIQRGKHKAYLLIPLEEAEDTYFYNPDNITAIKRGIEDVKAGRIKELSLLDIKKMLGL